MSQNPIAKAVTRIRPKVLPDKRRKLLASSTAMEQIMPKPLYTIYCKECDWESEGGEAGQDLGEFANDMRKMAKRSCPKCGARQLYFRGNAGDKP